MTTMMIIMMIIRMRIIKLNLNLSLSQSKGRHYKHCLIRQVHLILHKCLFVHWPLADSLRPCVSLPISYSHYTVMLLCLQRFDLSRASNRRRLVFSEAVVDTLEAVHGAGASQKSRPRLASRRLFSFSSSAAHIRSSSGHDLLSRMIYMPMKYRGEAAATFKTAANNAASQLSRLSRPLSQCLCVPPHPTQHNTALCPLPAPPPLTPTSESRGEESACNITSLRVLSGGCTLQLITLSIIFKLVW